jgi:hypothetical protein
VNVQARQAPKDAKAARRVAASLLEHLLGSRPTRLRPMGGGLTNWVFAARHKAGELVVRLSPDPGRRRTS